MSKSYSILLTILVTFGGALSSSFCFALTQDELPNGQDIVRILNKRFQGDLQFEFKAFGTDVGEGRRLTPVDWAMQIIHGDQAYHDRLGVRFRMVLDNLEDSSEENERRREALSENLTKTLNMIEAKQFSDLASFVKATGRNAVVVNMMHGGRGDLNPAIIILPANPKPFETWEKYLGNQTLELAQFRADYTQDSFNERLNLHFVGANYVMYSDALVETLPPAEVEEARHHDLLVHHSELDQEILARFDRASRRSSDFDHPGRLSESGRDERLENFLLCYEELRNFKPKSKRKRAHH